MAILLKLLYIYFIKQMMEMFENLYYKKYSCIKTPVILLVFYKPINLVHLFWKHIIPIYNCNKVKLIRRIIWFYNGGKNLFNFWFRCHLLNKCKLVLTTLCFDKLKNRVMNLYKSSLSFRILSSEMFQFITTFYFII